MDFGRFFSKKEERDSLKKSLSKTKKNIIARISRLIVGKSVIDEDLLDHLEEVLIASDLGVCTTLKIIKKIQSRIERDKYVNINELTIVLKEEIISLLYDAFSMSEKMDSSIISRLGKPHVIVVTGVNGVGKTTTVGKLAYHYKKLSKKVFLGAADTFRAAAAEQLDILSNRIGGVPIVKHGIGSDSAAVVHDTLISAIAHNADIVIIDTAGRLHNKTELMNDLPKINRIAQKLTSNPPEVLLVLDCSTGQNAYNQVKEFSKIIDVTALVVTKLDGTAKGGVVVGISDQLRVPIKYIGVGENLEDLQIFRSREFVNSLLSEW